MFERHIVETKWGGRSLTLESGRIARQADGSVLVTYGETTVMCSVVFDKLPKPEYDFFPLTVNYVEKTYAAGRIPGGFFKREARPSENETLVCRLIDRSIRPLFSRGYKNDTQVICTILSHDMENNPDIVAMIATSAALMISGIPFQGPIGSARVGFIDDKYVLNPNIDDMLDSELDLVVAGTDNAILMVESEAKILSEEIMLGAVMFGQKELQPVINAVVQLAQKCAKKPHEHIVKDHSSLEERMKTLIGKDIENAYKISDKKERYAALEIAKEKAKEALLTNEDGEGETLTDVFESVQSSFVRSSIIKTGQRIDGRTLSMVRPIESEVGILPRTHGSALFTRGETQAIVVATLGTADDEQFIDSLTGNYKENFLLHYNFPPYSVGETGRIGFTSRREIGHGKLAWRAVRGVLPSKEEFPYTLRAVSEITESNGSSSMATVCGASLAFMDAGVPLKAPVAGIAMGLIKEGDDFVILSDILGDEDHLGDMDFKVAGTSKGITSLQMDIKVTGITEEIMKAALDQAQKGREYILGEMNKAISVGRPELRDFAPRIESFRIPTEKIREVIGSGGKVIREIVEKTGAKVNIEDDGIVKVSSSRAQDIDAAVSWIRSITDDPEVGCIYQGAVVKTVDFGAFVNFFGTRDGLVHISQLVDKRVGKTTDVVNEGDNVWVKLIGFDDRGKFRLSMKVVDQKTGLSLPSQRERSSKSSR
ncbi:polyribonucleotide nucleotidyltransferase [Candidatus Endowatersipora endosymbiont of Watersipora subatra]|uniref:polyribonucleotide nucleotidyltransferase n=1 Tax=Candidatus Endowatersipora endosymbiont of Watersipora subatra TaxID=3077946 RepID=UPI00312C9BD8